MSFKPLQDRVVVRRIDAKKKTDGGIFIPDAAQEKPAEGEIVAIGVGKVLEDGTVRELDVKAGDRIMFGKFVGNEIEVDGERLIVMREEDILGIIETS